MRKRYINMENKIDLINERIRQSCEVKQNFSDDLKQNILKSAKVIVDALKKGRRVFVVGNGGSAADAQHFAAELVGRYLMEREAMDVTALTTNSSILTALANDYSPEIVFSRQVTAHVKEGDILIGISTSGNSANVVEALKAGRKKDAVTIGLTGKSGGKMSKLCNIFLNVPAKDTPRVQESHIFIIHLICEFVEKEMAELR